MYKVKHINPTETAKDLEDSINTNLRDGFTFVGIYPATKNFSVLVFKKSRSKDRIKEKILREE